MIVNTLKTLIKKTLGLPSNSANEYLYGSRDDGLFGNPLAAEDSDIALIDGGFKLLTSNDKIIHKLSWDELVDVGNWRYQSASNRNMQKYMNSAPADRISDKYKSPWSRFRQATDRLGIMWSISDEYDVELKVGEEATSNRKAIFRTI